jgi:deoxyuridine 5'-triphosphate nucleotidohydrolase
MNIEFYRTRDNALPPRRAYPSDAGMDLAFAPENDKELVVEPGQSVLCQTGLKFGIPHGFMLQIMNRSSVASKRSLVVGAHVVDAGYNGEVFINLHNVGVETQVIEPGTRIAQAVLIPVMHVAPEELFQDDLYSRAYVESRRGDGALGSTDK